jgi:hypothetical protein
MIYWYRYFCFTRYTDTGINTFCFTRYTDTGINTFCFTRYTDTGINTFDLRTVDGCGLFIAVMVAMAGVVFKLKLKWLSWLSRPLATLTVRIILSFFTFYDLVYHLHGL